MNDAGAQPDLAQGRRGLWLLLVLLVLGLLAILVWLAARFEDAQAQERLDQEVRLASAELRDSLTQQVLSAQARLQPDAPDWSRQAAELLEAHRPMVRIELRDGALNLRQAIDSAKRPPVFQRLGREGSLLGVQLACASARRASSHAYGPSQFVPRGDGTGMEIVDLCLPLTSGEDAHTEFVIVSFSLADLLQVALGGRLAGNVEATINWVDGIRLAHLGPGHRGQPSARAEHLIDLPGLTLLLRLERWGGRAGLFPNVLTALVAAMSLALLAIAGLLVQDMRRRRRAEHGLAEALAFRKAMEDSLATGLRARDVQGRTTYVNPAFCQMVRREAAELLDAQGDPPYWPPEHAPRYRERQAQRLAGQAPPREGFESIFMRADGARFPVMVFEAPLIDAQGTYTGWMSAIVDISHQRQAEELSRTSLDRLQATARLAAVGEMASLLSHELNQPLAAISGYAVGSVNLLQALPEGPQRAMFEEALNQITTQARRAGSIIRSVHDFVRRRERERESVRPEAVIEAILPLVQLQARKIGASVEVGIEADLPVIQCDRTMVEQALLNLARNGLQSMDFPDIPVSRRRLSLAVQVQSPPGQPRRVRFSVADLGCGIGEALAPKLFTPFFTTRPDGMGLGLSLCRTVAEQHGGTLRHAPNRPQGTVFEFTIADAGLQGCADSPEPAQAAVMP